MLEDVGIPDQPWAVLGYYDNDYNDENDGKYYDDYDYEDDNDYDNYDDDNDNYDHLDD